MLGNEYGLFRFMKLGQDFRRLALKSCYQFSFHKCDIILSLDVSQGAVNACRSGGETVQRFWRPAP